MNACNLAAKRIRRVHKKGHFAAISARSAAEAVAHETNFAMYAAKTAAMRHEAFALDVSTIEAGQTAKQLLTGGLWPAENPLAEEWQAARNILESDPVDQSFWITWYENFLNGTPQNWEMLEEIALTLTPDDWESGSAHVNAMIADIQAKYITEKLPQADTLEIDPEIGKVEIKYFHATQGQIIETSLSQVEFALSVAAGSNCGLNDSSTAHIFLTFTLTRCRDNPNAIYQNYKIALDDIREGLAQQQYFKDPKLTALETVLAQQIPHLAANHPEVREAEETRLKYVLSTARIEVKTKIVAELDFVKAVAGAGLQKELELGSGLFAQEQPSEAQASATRRFFGRIGQLFSVLRNASANVIKKIDASSGYKFTKIMQTLQKLVDLIAGLF